MEIDPDQVEQDIEYFIVRNPTTFEQTGDIFHLEMDHI